MTCVALGIVQSISYKQTKSSDKEVVDPNSNAFTRK
jgi:hypothetical protein